MPLKALVDAIPIYAWDMDETNRGKPFKCPHCPDTLILVLPTCDIIKHFRHKNNEAHGEPETPEHLNGKKLLLNWFKVHGVMCEPEVRVGQHICDVSMEQDGSKTFFEFQCSPISTAEILDRERSYDDAGFYCWIFGGHYYKNARNFRWWKNGKYTIQRITKAERQIGVWQSLLYLDTNTSILYKANWKTRTHSSVLGWYNLKPVDPSYLLNLDFFTDGLSDNDLASRLERDFNEY